MANENAMRVHQGHTQRVLPATRYLMNLEPVDTCACGTNCCSARFAFLVNLVRNC